MPGKESGKPEFRPGHCSPGLGRTRDVSSKKWDLGLETGWELQGKEWGEHSRLGGGHGVSKEGVVVMEERHVGGWWVHQSGWS